MCISMDTPFASSFHRSPCDFERVSPSTSYATTIRRPRWRYTVAAAGVSKRLGFLSSKAPRLHNAKLVIRASASNDAAGQMDDGDKASLQERLHRLRRGLATGTRHYMARMQDELKAETGLDIQQLKTSYSLVAAQLNSKAQHIYALLLVSKRALDEYASQLRVLFVKYWPQFTMWNRLVYWKDVKRWDAQRVGALVLYILIIATAFRSFHSIFIKPRIVARLANEYMEAVIPNPTVQNVKRLRKAMWRKRMAGGFRMQRYVHGPDGRLHHDPSFVGENPWDSEQDETPSSESEIMDTNLNMTEEENAVATQGEIEGKGKMPWQERLKEWVRKLELEDLKDSILAEDSEFVIPMDLDALKKSALETRANQLSRGVPRSFIMARKWWQYRPKLPYTYFLTKVQKLEVESAVYTEDLRKLFVKMREGFPAEYIVDIPVDPYLYDLMRNSNVKMEIMSRSEWSYYLRALLVLAPSLLILLQIRQLSLHGFEKTSEKIIDLLKMDGQHLILPEDAADKAKTEYKDVVVADSIWDVLEEVMHYMREPMRYYGKGLKFPRGILISGPPGTGKTLLARAIARESGLPFVFASGAEFVESSTGDGVEKVFNIFYTARANAPSFVFIDEIDALAGKGVDEDPERRATFDQLLAELDGEPEETDVPRFSPRQAVVLICATNRPDELHASLKRPGRIDREIHMGLPRERDRIKIFGVHSAGRRLGKDVDFSKLVFRTVGYSGADIRNLINEAGIMAVRRGRDVICQQDFVDVLDKQLYEGLGMSMTEEERKRAEDKVHVNIKRLLAVHEAGHVVLAHLFPSYDWHALTHILPAGKETALSLFYPREEALQKGYTTVGYLRMQMVVAHGGRCAERIVFGSDVTDGGIDDLAKISKIAREITISHASPRLGLYPMIWKDKFDPPVFPDEVDLIPNTWSRPGNRVANMSMELSEIFTREVTRYSDETEEQAMQGLLLNRHILDKIADELFTRTSISGLEIADIINSMNPVRFQEPLDTMMAYIDKKRQIEKFGRYEELDIWQAPQHQC